MTLVMAMEHPVLNFCACLKSFSIGHCACEVVELPPAEPDCCHNGQAQADLASVDPKPCPPEQCATTIDFDIGDISHIYLYDKVETVYHSDFQSTSGTAPFLRPQQLHFRVMENPSRGSPASPPPLPLHKMVAVFLI
ncbi:hypothetical protein [Rubritalea marina]|uniref:hypothetical protein n=1 Tax=Rubritalea marina TaxID=361055 RepID=UPI00038253F0|nr:hypothetical protein [Rubritalea marina]